MVTLGLRSVVFKVLVASKVLVRDVYFQSPIHIVSFILRLGDLHFNNPGNPDAIDQVTLFYKIQPGFL